MRLQYLDQLRGIAILGMILFHLNYYLVYLFEIYTFQGLGWFWIILGKGSAILFIFIAGFSYYLTSQKYKEKIYRKYIKVSFLFGAIASGITLITYFFFPSQYIVFGIIHFFALAFLLILLFSFFSYWNVLMGVILIFGSFYFPIEIESRYLFPLGFTFDGFRSADYYPIIPYFGYMLLGYGVGKYLWNQDKMHLMDNSYQNNFSLILAFIGRHSLIIYLAHPPILVTIIYIIIKGI